MQTTVDVDAGICGLKTCVRAASDDMQMVTFQVASGCEKIRAFGEALASHGPVDGYAEIGAGADGVVLSTGRAVLKGCCGGCVVPIAVFKAMQVAAGVALPKDIHLEMKQE